MRSVNDLGSRLNNLLPSLYRGVKMNEKTYKKKLDFQSKTISRQSKQIEDLKLQNDKLKMEIQRKDELINSVIPLKEELAQNIEQAKLNKKEYVKLINEVRKMKEILNQSVYKGRWWLIRFLIK